MNLQVIINKGSRLARKERTLAIIKSKFGALLCGIRETSCAQDASDAAGRAANSDIDTLVVVGGDGTVNGVLQSVAGTTVALGIIPGGTANDLASLYERSADVAAACDVILRRKLRSVDLIGINGRYFVTGGGLGLPSEVAAHVNAVKCGSGFGTMLGATFGSKLYVMSAVSALVRHVYEKNLLTMQWGRDSLTADCLSLTVSNQPFVGRHFFLSPRAANNDGVFDVCLIENSPSRVQVAATLTQVLRGAHSSSSSLIRWRAQELIVRAAKPLPFFGDGEHLHTADVFTVKIYPKSLNLIVPGNQTQAEIRSLRERNSHGVDN